ncbi:ABC transporter permease subunit [Microbacterium album]|uniref:ABC transporter permease n=1 Tax=Microbacterium album TaxID=2053191 RepID=A0A917IFG7_9MICO|nr:ABC transporter permease subunit [Microbacterium album]GGH44611.1 ABC transporter permease [Microbacterium album]
MNATTMTRTATPRRATFSEAAPAVTFARLARAEWIGLWSLRGTSVALAIGALLTIASAVGFAAMWGFASTRPDSPLPAEAAPPLVAMALNGIVIVQVVGVLLGVSAFAKEHSTGSLRSQLAAAPRRRGLLGAKALVVGAVSLVWSIVVLAVGLAGVALVYAAFDLPPRTGDVFTGLLLPLAGGAVLVGLSAVLGVAVGALLRSETWGMTLVLLFLLLLPGVLLTLPFDWANRIGETLMGHTGAALYTPHESVDPAVLGDIALTLAWPAVALAAALVVVARRDA